MSIVGPHRQVTTIGDEDKLATMAAFHGRLPEFSGAADEWEVFAEQLEHYFAANGIDDDGKQRAIMLSACGTATYKLLKTLVTPDALTTKTFDELVGLATEHHNPKPSVIMRRFRFNTCVRQQGESITSFVTRLRDLASHCEYSASAKELIRDRLVCGIRDDALQRSLLAVAGLTFEKAFERALLHESAVQNARMLNAPADVHRTPLEPRSTPSEGRQQAECYRCGGSHAAKDCRFRDSVCNYCHKKGHIQRVCRSRLQQRPQSEAAQCPQQQQPSRKSSSQQRRTHRLDGDLTSPNASTSSTPWPPPDATVMMGMDYNMFTVGSDRVAPFTAMLEVNGVPLGMEVDTGAALSLISAATYAQLWPAGNSPQLRKPSIRLRTYTGEELQLVGEAVVRVQYQNQQEELNLVVVKGSGPSLLGRDWLQKIRLNWAEVRSLKAASTTLEQVLVKHSGLFKDELGTIKVVTAKFHVDPNAKPHFFRPRPVPYALRSRVDQALEKLETAGIVESVRFSERAAPIVPVVKRDGTIRICGDYKLTVNQASQVDTYPLPLVDSLFASLAGGKSFTKLDLAHAYNQLQLDEDSRKYVTINTHKGLFQYTRLPFGVASAPAIFQRTMESILRGLPHVCVYLDDILVTGESDAAHIHNLTAVLDRLESAGIRLKREKCAFMLPKVEYLGHTITARGLQPQATKVRAIADASPPVSVSQLKAFLGMLNYYSRFLPDLATLLAPLYTLLQSARKWSWEEPQQRAFNEAKKLLTTSTLLTHFDPKKPVILSCDASPYGVGAVLSHQMDDGTEQPICFASRTLSAAERNYAQLDKEALAIIFGVKRFHQYLYGRKFNIYSDHKPLQYLLGETRGIPAMASARVQRWALTLSAYDYTITYKAGAKLANADALSRLPLPEQPSDVPIPGDMVLVFETLNTSLVHAAQIRSWVDKDPLLARVRENVRHGWQTTTEAAMGPYQLRKHELSMQDGCLLWGSRVVVPPQGRGMVTRLLHEGHPGICRMKRLARGYVWWPGMDGELEQVVKRCSQCQENQKLPPRAPMHPWEWPERPWARIHIDYAGPIRGKMLLVVVDAHSKWVEAVTVSSATSQVTIEKLRHMFATHGLPEVLVSDNGTPFTSAEFSTFMEANGIRHLRSAPYHPASNGLAERAVQTLKSAIRKSDGGVSLEAVISQYLFQYRLTPHSTTGVSPAELLMNRRPRCRLDLLRPDVSGRVRQKQEQQKANHDQHIHARNFKVGDLVSVKNQGTGAKWLPGVIETMSSPEQGTIQLEDGRVIRRHVDHLRHREQCEQSGRARSPGPPGPIGPDDDSPDLHTPNSDLPDADDTTPHQPVEPPVQPQLRRSTRDRHPPDRLM